LKNGTVKTVAVEDKKVGDENSESICLATAGRGALSGSEKSETKAESLEGEFQSIYDMSNGEINLSNGEVIEVVNNGGMLAYQYEPQVNR
jgi:hypothetical protein